MSTTIKKVKEKDQFCATGSCDKLPDDIWEYIFMHLQYNYRLQPISLVSKRFLALSNNMRLNIKISSKDKPIPILPLCNRFPNVRLIQLTGPHPNLATAVTLLANSAIPLTFLGLSHQTHFPGKAMRLLGRSMSKTLKALSCVEIHTMVKSDLDVITNCFPYLRHLEILGFKDRLSDKAILAMVSKLRHLASLKADYTPNCAVHLGQFLSFSSLTSLQLAYVNVSETVLVQLSRANLKLRRLGLSAPKFSNDVTGATLCGFLKSCGLLIDFQFVPSEFTANMTLSARDLADSITSIQKINVYYEFDHPIREATLFYTLKNCRDVKNISIGAASMGCLQRWADMPVRSLVRQLALISCDDLCDEALKLITSVCPSLEILCLQENSKITNIGIDAVKANCRNIKLLLVKSCDKIEDFIWRED